MSADNEKSRAEFELAYAVQYLRKPQNWDGAIGAYRDAHSNGAWWGWQASRKALAVELPKAEDSPDIAYFEADVLDALCAVGITVKEPPQ